MTLPCSGNVSGIAVFSIGLLIQSRKGKPVPGTPLRIKLRKECAHRGVYDRTSSLASSQGSVCLFYFLITYSPLALILYSSLRTFLGHASFALLQFSLSFSVFASRSVNFSSFGFAHPKSRRRSP